MKHVLYIILYYMNVPKTTKMCTNQNCGTVLCNAPELPNLYFFFAIFPGLERTPWEPSETFAARYLLWCHSPLGYSAEGWMPSDACDSLGFQTFHTFPIFPLKHWNLWLPKWLEGRTCAEDTIERQRPGHSKTHIVAADKNGQDFPEHLLGISGL